MPDSSIFLLATKRSVGTSSFSGHTSTQNRGFELKTNERVTLFQFLAKISLLTRHQVDGMLKFLASYLLRGAHADVLSHLFADVSNFCCVARTIINPSVKRHWPGGSICQHLTSVSMEPDAGDMTT